MEKTLFYLLKLSIPDRVNLSYYVTIVNRNFWIRGVFDKVSYVKKMKKFCFIVSTVVLLTSQFSGELVLAAQETTFDEIQHTRESSTEESTIAIDSESVKQSDPTTIPNLSDVQESATEKTEEVLEKSKEKENQISNNQPVNDNQNLNQRDINSITEVLTSDSKRFLAILNTKGATEKTLFSRIIEQSNLTDKPSQNGSHKFYRNSLPYEESSIWRSKPWKPAAEDFNTTSDYQFFKKYISRFDSEGEYKQSLTIGNTSYHLNGKLTGTAIENLDSRDVELVDLLSDLTVANDDEGMRFLGKRSEKSFDNLLINQGLSKSYEVGKFSIVGKDALQYQFKGKIKDEKQYSQSIDIDIGSLILTNLNLQLTTPNYVVSLEEGATNYDHDSLSDTPIFVDGLEKLCESGQLSIANLVAKKMIPAKPSQLIEEHSTTLSKVGNEHILDNYLTATYKNKTWGQGKYLKTVLLKFELRDAVSQQPSFSIDQTGSENLILLADSKYKEDINKIVELKNEMNFISLKESSDVFKTYLESHLQHPNEHYEAPAVEGDLIGIQQEISCVSTPIRKEAFSEVTNIFLEKNSPDQLKLHKSDGLTKEPIVIYKTQKTVGSHAGEVVLEKVRLSMQKGKSVADFRVNETDESIEIIPLSDRMKNLKADEKLELTYHLSVTTGDRKIISTAGKVVTPDTEKVTARRDLSFYKEGDLRQIKVKYVYEDSNDQTQLPKEVIESSVNMPSNGEKELILPIDLSDKHYQYSGNSLDKPIANQQLVIPFSEQEQTVYIRYYGETWIESIENDLYFKGKIGIAKQDVVNRGSHPMAIKIKSTDLENKWQLIGEASEFKALGTSVPREALDLSIDGESISQGGAIVHNKDKGDESSETNITIGSNTATAFNKKALLAIAKNNYKWAQLDRNYQASIIWKLKQNQRDYQIFDRALPKKVVR